jgi:hypothetical protein
MASEAEVEAAAKALAVLDYVHENWVQYRPNACAALEAAERVRDRELSKKLVGLGIEMGYSKYEVEAEIGLLGLPLE